MTGPAGPPATPDLPNGGLIVSLQGSVAQIAPIGAGIIRIGRLPENTVVLPDSSVSRYHAEVRLEGRASQATVTDVGSSGGTWIGEEQLKPNQPYALRGGMTFRIGPFELQFVAPTGTPALPPRVPPPVAPARDKAARGARRAPEAAEPESLDELTVIEHPVRPLHRPLLPPAWRGPTRGPTGLVDEPYVSGPQALSRYLRFLPAIYHEADFLGRFLLIFESVWEPLEWRAGSMDMYFDPRTAPAQHLPWLAGWLGLDLDRHWPEERRRLLLTEAMELYRARGTPYGLIRMIEVCTGLSATVTEDPRTPYVFRIRVSIPPDSMVRREMLERLIQLHKPAHVGYVLETNS